MSITGARGQAPSFWFRDTYYRSIATDDYYPGCAADVAAGLNAAQISDLWGGFFVRPDADGALYVITLAQYEDNGFSLTGLVPVQLMALTGVYEYTRVVKVYAHDDATYTSAASNINVSISK